MATAAKKPPKPRRRQTNAPRKSRTRTGLAATSVGIVALGIGAALLGFVVRRARHNPAEHAAPDLALDRPRPNGDDRAPDAFRPDPTAPVPAGMRDSLRPATGHAPGFAADRGSTTGV